MTTWQIGYDAAGTALDYTTLSAALADTGNVVANDTLELYYGTANKSPVHMTVNEQHYIDRDLTIVGGLPNLKTIIMNQPSDANTYAGLWINGGQQLTTSNLTFMGSGRQSYGVMIHTNGSSLIANRCRFIGHFAGIRLGSADVNSTLIMNNLEFISCYAGFYSTCNNFIKEPNVPVYNISTLFCGYGIFINSAYNNTQFDIKNSACMGSYIADFYEVTSGSFTNCEHNRSTDGTHPGTNGGIIDIENSDVIFYNSYQNYLLDARVESGSVLLGVGTDVGLTEDIDGSPVSAPFPIGCSNGTNTCDPDKIIASEGGNWDDSEIIPANLVIGTTAGVSNSIVGTFDETTRNTDPGVENVKEDIEYLLYNELKTGELATGILTPTLSIDGNLVATISDGEPTYTNYLVVKKSSSTKYHSVGSRTGNGTITITGLSSGDYIGHVVSVGSPGTVSDYVAFSVSGDALSGVVNSNWGRWIYASVCKFFNTYKDTLTMFIEGDTKNTDSLTEWFELRVDGPYYKQINNGWWDCIVEINTVFTLTNRLETYYPREYGDKLAALFANSIPIYRLGDGIYDDDSLVGCLESQDKGREKLQVNHFGVMPNGDFHQGAIERHYKITLQEE